MNIDELVNILKAGKLAIIPTDTIYGIVADATNEDAIKKVYEVKQRDYNKPLIILVSSIKMLKDYVKDISSIEENLIKKYWPGKLTILFKKNNNVLNIINNNSELIGIRLPNDKSLIELIDKLGTPIISTSANLSGEKAIISIDRLNEIIKSKIDYIYDDGVKDSSPSTIIKVVEDKIEFIRKEELAELIEKDFQ